MNRGKRLLCFDDGGGVRGISALYILEQLLTKISDPPPKPCDYFDMIGGTGTGGLIAIMLGLLELSIEDCIEEFSRMLDSIFKKECRWYAISVRELDFKPRRRFDGQELERCIKQVITQSGFDAETLMQRSGDMECKVFVCVEAIENTSQNRYFTSWKVPQESESELSQNVKIWEAARATSARSGYFDPIMIGDNRQLFGDGGKQTNNPVDVMWQLAGNTWAPEEPLEHSLECLVSIGTGNPSSHPLGEESQTLMADLQQIAMETMTTAWWFYQDHARVFDEKGLYFRLNVPIYLEDIGIEDIYVRARMFMLTNMYGRQKEMRDMLSRFRNIFAAANGLILPSTLFDELDASPAFIATNTTSYWQRLTITALLHYEQIYDAIDKTDGAVTFPALLRQFSQRTTPSQVRNIWQRIHQDDNSSMSKNETMALLYMLHVETTLDMKPQYDQSGQPAFQHGDFAILVGCFANFVRCPCDCGRVWNFANETGMTDDITMERPCWIDAYNRASPIRQRRPSLRVFGGYHKRALDEWWASGENGT